MKGSAINVTTNINQTTLMLSCLPYDEAIWCIFKMMISIQITLHV